MRTLFAFFCLLFTTIITAQNNYNYFTKNNYYDITFSFGTNQFSESVSWTHIHSFGKNKKIQIGYGIRYTNYNSINKKYTTAPAKYTSTVQNLGTIFSENIVQNIDTLTIPQSNVNFINATIHLQYSFKRFDVNFNIDAIGISFGRKTEGRYDVNDYDPLITNNSPVVYQEEQVTKPTKYNLLLTSDNDIGSLNSELSVRYWLNNKIALRFGFCFLFTEYTTDNKLRLNNDRFRYKSKMALISITYAPFKNINK